MAGRGVPEAEDKAPIPNVWMLTEKMEWAPAIDPLHFDKPTIVGVGVGRSFARALLARRPTASIGLIPAAFGGSALDEWKPEGKDYPNAVARAKEAMKSGKLRGILWHQGEADCKAELAGTYRDRFATFIGKLRADLGAGDVPVMVGQLGEFFSPESEWPKKITEQLATIPLVVPKSIFVPSAGLRHKGDNVHFDSPSLREFGRRYALAFLSLDTGWAAPAAAAAKPEVPSDRKAYNAAQAISDPEKKIAALEKFKLDFPESSMTEDADALIFKTLVRKLPEQKKRIVELAQSRYDEASEGEKGSIAHEMAVEMIDSGVHLKQAREWAEKSIKALSEEKYIDEQRALAGKRKQEPPPEAELRKRFKRMRAARIGTLGRIEVRRGNTAKGRTLLEEAFADNPGLAPVAIALADLRMQAGDDQQALDFLIAARLSGRATIAAISNFETIYRKLHKGSLNGAVEMLDQEYRKRFPNPVHAEPYRSDGKGTGHVVLAEVFTGAGCGPCVAADLAVDAVLERYARKDVAVVMYHQHIPRPDPMANVGTQDRRLEYSLRAVPTLTIDGTSRTGGGTRDEAVEQFKQLDGDIAKALTVAPGARLTAEGKLANGVVTVRAKADAVRDVSEPKLQVVLVEKELRYSGENGIRFHPMVVRAMAGQPLKGEAGAFDATFDLAKITADNKKHLDEYEKTRPESFRFSSKLHEMDPAKLAAVVWVEDPAAHRVVQALWLELDR
jgi:hypothetical protein